METVSEEGARFFVGMRGFVVKKAELCYTKMNPTAKEESA